MPGAAGLRSAPHQQSAGMFVLPEIRSESGSAPLLPDCQHFAANDPFKDARFIILILSRSCCVFSQQILSAPIKQEGTGQQKHTF